MYVNKVENDYFEWLYNYATEGLYSEKISYRKLFSLLHSTEFTYSIYLDKNRASDGIDLRYRYSSADAKYLTGPCSVLEMILGLAIRCEETIMDDPRYGDRTKQWFWGMINNLGLGGMYDSLFDKEEATTIINRFLDREYEPNGKGGLFTVRGTDDLRKVEIWCQLNWYLNTIC